ncbi:MAG: HEPN domain-containing protein [Deltaproteobacteria bacterium]|nr:HEPN domain-containing protein [Deltaproteobacteria bacterium]
MTRKIKTKSVEPTEFSDYWEKACHFFQGMSRAYTDQNWDSTALEGVHCAISAADAVLIYSRGFKSTSERHADVTTLVATLPLDGSQQASRHLAKLLSLKGIVEYTGESYTEKDAAQILNQVERFMNWVRTILPKA